MDEKIAVLALAGMIGAFALGAMLIWAWVRTRRLPPGSAPDQSVRLAAQLEAMQGSIEAIALEVERIAEGQRFTTRLLSERQTAKADPSLRSG